MMQCLESGKGCKVLEWKVEDGSFVNKDQIICKILEDGAESSRVLLAKHTGLIEVKAKTGTSADPRATLARFSPCTHNKMVVYGLCAICGQPAKNEKIVNTSGGVEISLSESSAKRFEGEVERRLQKEKKLAIAIDLDHTLINCEFIKGEGVCLIDDLIQSGRVGPLPGVPDHYIALRPNVREFLVNLSNMYELYIYTHGRRHYAEAIRAMLDPKGTLFADRVISRSDVSEGDEIENRDSSRTKLFHKTFKRVLPCNDSMIVALDDKWDVWKYLPNVVRVRPYAFVSRVVNERAQKAKKTEQLVRRISLS
jgi:RNA polymerase II subunit A-like phosphatase